jgi:2-dehydrotetronate isomerase
MRKQLDYTVSIECELDWRHMPRFAANLSMMYQEHAFLDRFQAAARDGFAAVEFLFPYEFDANEIAGRLKDNALHQVLFNAPLGDFNRGDRGLASIPGREDEFKRSIALALQYADTLDCPMIHVMAGLIGSEADRSAYQSTYVKNLAYAAQQAAAHGITVVIEPINPRNMPGYFLNRQHEAHQVCREVGVANLKVQMDLYHCQIVEGDLAVRLREGISGVAHIQIAGVPDRHEPDQGELNYPYLFELVDSLGYAGWIGCEYRPKAGTSEGLGWLRRWQR